MSKKLYARAIKNDYVLADVLKSFSSQMQSIAYSFYNEDSFVDEVIAETIYKVYKNRKQVRKVEYFKTWVMRILINECKKEMKRKDEYKEIFDIDNIETRNSKEFEYVHDYLRYLSETEQDLLRLKVFSGLTFLELSDVLNMPESTVKTQYYTALKKLKIEMEDLR